MRLLLTALALGWAAACAPWAGEDLAALGPPLRLVDVDCGPTLCCGVDADGDAWCWGAGALGSVQVVFDCAAGTWDSRCTGRPVRVWEDGRRRLEGLAMGGGAVCANDADGSVWCWGDDQLGQLGRGPEAALEEPFAAGMRQVALPAGVRLGALAAGDGWVCGLDADGQVWCWGLGGAVVADPGAPLDTPWQDPPRAPAIRPSLPSSATLAATAHSLCGLDTEGGAWCVGVSVLGVEDPPETCAPYEGAPQERCAREPVQVAGGPFTALYEGDGKICALDAAGAPWCWGANVAASTTERAGWTAVSEGPTHGCGVRSDGLPECWGRHLYQGEGAFGYSVLDGPIGAEGVRVGQGTTCLFGPETDTWCWGALGDQVDGRPAPRAEPGPIPEPWRD